MGKINTLDLCVDDDFELLEAIQSTFGITITEAEVEHLFTVGDLANFIENKLQVERGAACLSAQAFRRLRNFLPPGARPSSCVTEYCEPENTPKFLKSLGHASGLNLNMDSWDTNVFHDRVSVALGTACISIFIGLGFHYSGAIVFATIVALAWLMISPREQVRAQLTIAETINRTLVNNYQLLRGDQPSGTRSDIWHTLCGLCRYYSCQTHPINRRTTFFRNVGPPDQQGKN